MPYSKFNLFSKITKIYPIINEITVKMIYCNLKVCSELIFFTSIGILPNMRPMKQKLVWVGKEENRYFKIFPTERKPINAPNAIGKINKKFFLKSLNNPNNEFINLS